MFSFRLPRIIRLHNMFVLGSTDVLFLMDNKVVDIKRGFRPFTFYTPQKKATHVIELPAGRARDVAIGDRIVLTRQSMQ